MTERTPELPQSTGSNGSLIGKILGSGFIALALHLLIAAAIGRNLGAAGLGSYATAMAWVIPLSLLANAGISMLIGRDLSYPRMPSSRAYLQTALLAYCIIGLPLILLVVVGAPLLTGSAATAEALTAAAPRILLMPMLAALVAVLKVRAPRYAALINGGGPAVLLIVVVMALQGGSGLRDVVTLHVIVSVVQLMIGAAVWYFTTGEDGTNTPVGLRDLLMRARPFWFAGLLVALPLQLNIILTERLTAPYEVGSYAAALHFVELGRFVPLLVIEMALPFLGMMAGQPAAFRRTFGLVLKGLTAYGVVAGLLTWLLAYALINAFFGADFLLSPEVLRVMALAFLPMVLRATRELYLYAFLQQAWVTRVSFFALIGQLIAGLLIIPQHGAIGAAWVLVVSQAVAAAILWFVRPPAKPQ